MSLNDAIKKKHAVIHVYSGPKIPCDDCKCDATYRIRVGVSAINSCTNVHCLLNNIAGVTGLEDIRLDEEKENKGSSQ